MIRNFIGFFLKNKLVSYLLLILFIGWGLSTAPFDFGLESLPRDPVAVDAIPDIGENQQIVFTEWKGRSPQDVEDQITYPLTSALLGIPGVKSIRSNSMFGFSSIYIIFKDDVEFYWSRSRILEKLNSLPANTLPEGIQPTLGPDATALGQIFWYTLEGQDKEGNPTGGWDLHELRSIQDFTVRFALSSAEGVAEVASIGGFVKEYQVDVDPDAMRAYNISLEQVMKAIKQSNLDIGAQTLEINLAEYFVRGLGYVKSLEDIENSVVTVNDNTPVLIRDIAHVSEGPASRRGVLDKSGAEAVGGVVVARYGANPMEVIQHVKEKIKEVEPGLASKTLADGTFSQVKIVPFYDRTELINETIGTLYDALSLEILITILVVILMLLNFRSSLLVSGSLPVAVLMSFIAMRYFGVDANIVALSGIAIAIGTMVDMGIVLTESMVKRIREAPPDESLFTSIHEATVEVASAVITAVTTTVISFLPVFTMQAAEGKLFRPLAFTKTFALIASIVVALTIIPPLAHTIFSWSSNKKRSVHFVNGLAVLGGAALMIYKGGMPGLILLIVGLTGLLKPLFQRLFRRTDEKWLNWGINLIYALLVSWLLAVVWMPLGVTQSNFINFLFIALLAGVLIGFFYLVIYYYESILRFLLRFKLLFLILVGFIVYQGFLIFRDAGQEFMPALDEGSFLLMPTSMPHSGMQENVKNLRLLDMAVTAIPEVETVVGKAGRVNSPLDPAPMSMYENVILYKSEYKTNKQGRRVRFAYEDGEFIRDEKGALVPDKKGQYYRQWRDHIKSPDDIWEEIVEHAKLPGITSAPKLQPIETRLVMLQTGMRAPMGIKVKGPDLSTIEEFGLELEDQLKEVEGVKESAVFADRIVGKPYLLLDIDREKISRYGLTVAQVQKYIQTAIGGMVMTTTVEGRERYGIRIRYPRELRNDPEQLKQIYLPASNGQQIPLGDLVDIRYEQGAQSIKSEDGFLLGYVLFDRENDFSEVEVVNNAKDHLNGLIEKGELIVPDGISYRFAGNYEQQVRANKRLSIVLPVALVLIFLILYFQFSSVMISLMVFTGVFIAFAGGFIMIGLYDTNWFLDFSLFGADMRDLFQIRTINLSVAVWVGFLALFGIATDDGVLVATFLKDSFKKNKPESVKGIRNAVVEGGLRRVRPAMMTTATTILALLPILTSTGRGSDIMLPMAIPSFGGMSLQVITMFTVPVLFALWKEWSLKFKDGFRLSRKTIQVSSLIFVFSISAVVSAQGQRLDSLLNLVESDNLELQAGELEYQAATLKAPQVSQLPDPDVMIGAFPFPVETRLGPQLLRWGATQMFPWPGTLKQKKDIALEKATLIRENTQITNLELRYRIKKAYLELYELMKSQELIKKGLPVLESLQRVVLARVESGKRSSSDVLLIQLKIEELKQDLKILEAKKKGPEAVINQVLNRPGGTPVIIRDRFDFVALPYDKSTLEKLVRDHHPSLEQLNIKQDLYKKSIALNDIKSKPSFGLGLDHILVGKRSDMDPDHNGRDILQLRASVKIPLFSEQYKAKEQEEQIKIATADLMKEEVINKYMSEIEQALAMYEMASLRYELYRKQKKILRQAIQLMETEYSVTGDRFDELLEKEKTLIDYDLNILKATVQSQQAKIRIEKFINR